MKGRDGIEKGDERKGKEKEKRRGDEGKGEGWQGKVLCIQKWCVLVHLHSLFSFTCVYFVWMFYILYDMHG